MCNWAIQPIRDPLVIQPDQSDMGFKNLSRVNEQLK